MTATLARHLREPLARRLRGVPRLAAALGALPRWFGYRHVERETVPEHIVRRGAAAGRYETCQRWGAARRPLSVDARQAQGEHTLIVIAHRLSTVRNCDTLFMLDQGRLVAEGSYDELMARSDTFRRMAGKPSTVGASSAVA